MKDGQLDHLNEVKSRAKTHRAPGRGAARARLATATKATRRVEVEKSIVVVFVEEVGVLKL